jgi:hypothetical protein
VIATMPGRVSARAGGEPTRNVPVWVKDGGERPGAIHLFLKNDRWLLLLIGLLLLVWVAGLLWL